MPANIGELPKGNSALCSVKMPSSDLHKHLAQGLTVDHRSGLPAEIDVWVPGVVLGWEKFVFSVTPKNWTSSENSVFFSTGKCPN